MLDLAEAAEHPHNLARELFVKLDEVLQPSPAPRFSRTPGQIQGPPPQPGEHTKEVLADWGFSSEAIAALECAGVI